MSCLKQKKNSFGALAAVARRNTVYVTLGFNVKLWYFRMYEYADSGNTGGLLVGAYIFESNARCLRRFPDVISSAR